MDDILHIPQTSWIYFPLYTLLPNWIYSPLYIVLPNNFGNPSSLDSHMGDSNNLVNYLKDSGFTNNIISCSIGMC